MGDDFKCGDRFDKFDKDCRHDDFHGHDDDWSFGDWLPIIIIVFLLCGERTYSADTAETTALIMAVSAAAGYLS
jgi:hypothetical protein